MGFDQALKMMRQNFHMTRTDWGDQARTVSLENDHFFREEAMEIGHHYVIKKRVKLEYHPTVTDVLAMDWELVR